MEVGKRASSEVGQAKTKREASKALFEIIVRHYHRESLLKELGTYDLDLNLEKLDRLRNTE